ncbi:hypothetical protein B0H16DRAFT_1533372 [Mycena metata]|uniref:DUF5648 domain-containing protein n=1 Tax=Mycena metata TaxID=1033252 RepID=A0AAD7JB59_9AGAR|nr:hypothetical protein B0H16DRAFT_1533372 [Mycena metata]
MKYIVSAIFVSLAFGLASAFNIQEPGANLKRSEDTCGSCGNPADALPFYRTFVAPQVDHCYTTNLEIVNGQFAAYRLQGVAGLVFATQEASTVPFYRLYNPTIFDSFYTTSATEKASALANGYVINTSDPVTYIYPTQICGSVPFYRLYSANETDNFYTTSESEMLEFIANEGYTYVEIAGYILPVSCPQCG